VRVLHIASGRTGGARLAAERLSNYQSQFGIQSNIFPDNGSLDQRHWLGTLASKTVTLTQTFLTKDEYGVFSSMSSSRIDLEQIRNERYDIAHIHNWFNVLNLEDINKLAKIAPIVFTLHDERMITGGCHYTFSCENYKVNCNSCPGVHAAKILVKRKKIEIEKLFQSIPNYGVITPSKWIKDKSKSEGVIKNSKITRVIPNLIDFPSDFKVKNWEHTMIRRITFIAADVDEDIKGFDILVNALSALHHDGAKFHLDVIGKKTKNTYIDFPHQIHGYLNSEQMRELLFNNGLCVIPSKLDNLPTTGIEAILAGNILVVAKVGGLPELVDENLTGFICQPNSESIKKTISWIFESEASTISRMREKSIARARVLYKNSTNNLQHNLVYENLINNA